MKVVENYRPEQIDFTAETSLVPKVLGEFESEEDARVFMAENLLAVQSKVTAERYMDHIEIESLRQQYVEELEDVLPQYREEHLIKDRELEQAKKNEKEAKEMVNASLNKVQQLANEVNSRVTEIDLDPQNTWQVAYEGNRYYYTFMDGELKLAHFEDIPSYESDDLITTSEKNASFFEKVKKAANE